MKPKIALAAAVASLTAVGTVYAGNLDRSVFSPSILFEDGTYTEVAYGFTDPSIETTSGVDVANAFHTVKIGFKTDLTERLAVAFMFDNQPIGSDIDYENVLAAPLTATVDASVYRALAKYKATDNISVFGGVRYQTAGANANLSGIGLTTYDFETEGDFGYVVGAAYEIPSIALRVSAYFESKIEHTLTTTSTAFGNSGNTEAGSAPAYNIEFQTGIAPNTLLFGSFRHADWSQANIFLATGTPLGTIQLTNFDDINTYKLGVARKFTDRFSATFNLEYEPDNDQLASPFNPQDGLFGFSLGGKFTVGNGVDVSLGVKYTERGGTTTTAPVSTQFGDDNNVTTLGIKLSKTF